MVFLKALLIGAVIALVAVLLGWIGLLIALPVVLMIVLFLLILVPLLIAFLFTRNDTLATFLRGGLGFTTGFLVIFIIRGMIGITVV